MIYELSFKTRKKVNRVESIQNCNHECDQETNLLLELLLASKEKILYYISKSATVTTSNQKDAVRD